MIRIKRAYDSVDESDGTRFLVDHLWPRGITKDHLRIEAWLRDISPSDELRKWFQHDPAKWHEFERRYWNELKEHRASLQPLLDAAHHGDVTLVYGARDTEHNNAVALKAFLEKALKTQSSRTHSKLVAA